MLSQLGPSCQLHLVAMHQPRLFRQTGGKDKRDLDHAMAQVSRFCASLTLVEIPSEATRPGRAIAAARAAVTGRSYTEEWLASSKMRSKLEDIAARVDPHIAHFDTISLAPYMRHVPPGARVSLGHHNVESHMMWRRARNSRAALSRCLLLAEARRILQLERQYVPVVDVNVVCSELDARRLRRMSGAKSIHVAENGVLEPQVSAGSLEDAGQSSHAGPALAFVGRMSAYTNRDAAEFLVRDIWPEVKRVLPDATLDMVGTGAPEIAFRLAASDQRVRVHGFVKRVADVLVPGSIFVCPVRDGGGTKLKILDAMNMGMPIVAHPAALEGIDVEDGTHVLVARTPGEFAAAIASLSSAERRMTMARRAFELVRERYSFDGIADRLLQQFAQVAQSPRGTISRGS